jgi:hypothetical protein
LGVLEVLSPERSNLHNEGLEEKKGKMICSI